MMHYDLDPKEGMGLAVVIVLAGIAAFVSALFLLARSRGYL
jgi:hypothetical protein